MNTGKPAPQTDTKTTHTNTTIEHKNSGNLTAPKNAVEVNECARRYTSQPAGNPSEPSHITGVADRSDLDSNNLNSSSPNSNGLSETQQQFVLKFCRQLVSVIEACEQNESAEIEVGRRQIDTCQIKIKLQAEREFTHP